MSDTRRLGVFAASAIGIGGMVGGGIFAVLGEAVSLAHGGTPLAFALAGVIAFLTAYAYARLSVAYPSQGGTVVFLHRAFAADLATGTLNAILWLSYLVTLALYAVAFSSYAATFFDGAGDGWLPHVLITGAIVVPAILNVLDSSIVGRSELVIVALKLALLGVVVGFGMATVEPARLEPAAWASPGSLAVAGLVIFVAYEGFELIANAAHEVRDPTRTLPRAYALTVLSVAALYVLVAIVTVGSVPEERIAEAQDYALAEAARPALGQAGFVCVAVSALLATLSAINATIYGGARLGYTLATDREMPPVLARRVWRRPVMGVLVVALLSALLANLVELTEIATLASAGFLLVFAAVNASALRLGPAIGARRWIAGLGMLACLGALGVLLAHAADESPVAVWLFVAFVTGALGFELVLCRILGRPIDIDRDDAGA